MIELENLSKRYGKTKAVNNVSLQIDSQNICAILGPNGAGKSTIIKILSTLLFPSSGKAMICGKDVILHPVDAKKDIGVVHQTLNLDPELTGYEILYIHALLFRMPISKIKIEAKRMLEFVGLQNVMKKRVSTYSGGMKRRLSIARALIHDPMIIILDEPTIGLDAHTRRNMWNLIRRLKETGRTILFTTHYIDEAENLADVVYILNNGSIIKTGSPKELIAEVGIFAVDIIQESNTTTLFFQTKNEATEYVNNQKNRSILRVANLEDVFIHITGKKSGFLK